MATGTQDGMSGMNTGGRQDGDGPSRRSQGVFRAKSIEQSIADTEEPEHGLRKTLSALDLMVYGVGVIVGTGIFVATGSVAKQYAGPAVALAFVASAVACALAALCYAEFASTVPVAGSWPPPPRRPATRSGTCRAASSAR